MKKADRATLDKRTTFHYTSALLFTIQADCLFTVQPDQSPSVAARTPKVKGRSREVRRRDRSLMKNATASPSMNKNAKDARALSEIATGVAPQKLRTGEGARERRGDLNVKIAL